MILIPIGNRKEKVNPTKEGVEEFHQINVRMESKVINQKSLNRSE